MIHKQNRNAPLIDFIDVLQLADQAR